MEDVGKSSMNLNYQGSFTNKLWIRLCVKPQPV